MSVRVYYPEVGQWLCQTCFVFVGLLSYMIFTLRNECSDFSPHQLCCLIQFFSAILHVLGLY